MLDFLTTDPESTSSDDHLHQAKPNQKKPITSQVFICQYDTKGESVCNIYVCVVLGQYYLEEGTGP